MAERELRLLLEKLCVELGFCLPPDANERLIANTPLTIVELTDAIFMEEGLDPTTADRHLYRQVKAVIEEAFRQNSGR